MNSSADTYHLVGVAGVGMNALAQAILAAGWKVTGSDRSADAGLTLEVVDKLKAAGVVFTRQDGTGISTHTRAIVVSSAIEKDNPDWLAAQRLGLPCLHRAAMLAELVAGQECIAITGTCGKTTVTGMVGFLLEQLGADPVVVNGGAVLNWVDSKRIGNVRSGRSRRWVIEADESDRSLLQFHPDWAIITNMSADHFSLEETRRLFAEFQAGVRCGVVDGSGAGPWREMDVQLTAEGSRFTYKGVEFQLSIPGRHNVQNALQALALCELLACPLEPLASALVRFRGIERRLERVGRGQVAVFDDYAHNPEKIVAAWRTLIPYYGRVLALWRPHGFRPLALLMDDLARSIAEVARAEDRLWLLPVYYAGGTADRSVNSMMLAERLRARGVKVECIPDYDALTERLLAACRPGDAVLSMGARDPELPRFARRLAVILAGVHG